MPKINNIGKLNLGNQANKISAVDISKQKEFWKRIPWGGLNPVFFYDASLNLPSSAFYVGSYYKIPVSIRASSGLSIDDLNFEIPDGAKAGIISLSKDSEDLYSNPNIMLIAGFNPGIYDIVITKKSDNSELYRTQFKVTSEWSDKDKGPNLGFVGTLEGFVSGAAWGGGSTGVQNSNILPASGTRRICIILADTSDQRWPTDATTINNTKTDLLNQMVGGVTGGDGVVRSTQLYYREVSYNNFDLSAQIFGPYNLPSGFDTYFNADGSGAGGFIQAVSTLADSDVNFNNFDSIVVITQSVGAPGDATYKAAWPFAWGESIVTAEGTISKRVLSMPSDWPIRPGNGTPARQFFHTYSHELGHNLGFGDQYKPAGDDSQPDYRYPGEWETMAWEGKLAHFSAFHRLATGWLQPGWVKTYNFATAATPVDETITLHPIELGAPPVGRFSAIEVRIADGWNYYFEYRSGQLMQIGDRQLPVASAVVGTDVISSGFSSPIPRRQVLLLNNDTDGDGSVLTNGLDYEETDYTDPSFPADFKVDVSGADGSKADVRIRYGIIGKPDPSIRPWPASPERQWQSPDIEVRNAKNAADPAWFNVPWLGKPNTVVAQIKNGGTLAAPGVRANFYVKDYNIGGTPETYLGTDVKDIGPGATVEFTSDRIWIPPTDGHYCIVVRIPLYTTGGTSPVVEMTELNNVAQSNYDRFYSGTSSPANRVLSYIEVGNPYGKRTRIHVFPGQSNPLYRTYLENRWVVLGPGETRKIRCMFEYDPAGAIKSPLPIESFYDENGKLPASSSPQVYTHGFFDDRTGGIKRHVGQPNRVNLSSLIIYPYDDPWHTTEVMGGVDVEIVTGKNTQFRYVRLSEGKVVSRVITKDTGESVNGGLIYLSYKKKGAKDEELQAVVEKVDNTGTSTITLPGNIEDLDHDSLELYYSPAVGYTDCTQKLIKWIQ